MPKFRIKGSIDATTCYIWEPFTGELVIDYCEQAIKSIELQLVRVETCGCAEGYACEGIIWVAPGFANNHLNSMFLLVTEIQNIQIGDGEVVRATLLPIYMVFPRLFTCPTLITNNFKIGLLYCYMIMLCFVNALFIHFRV